MSGLPVYWDGVEPNIENLQNCVVGPFTAVVDPDIGSNTGHTYTNIQDAWEASPHCGSIFIKRGTYSTGLQVSTGLGNVRHHMRVIQEGGWARASSVCGSFGAAFSIADCIGLKMVGVTVKNNASGADFTFDSLQYSDIIDCHSENSPSDAFVFTQCSRNKWRDLYAAYSAGRGFVLYDAMYYNEFTGLIGDYTTGHCFNLDAFPTTNTTSDYNWFTRCRSVGAVGTSDAWRIQMYDSGSTKGWNHLYLSRCLALTAGGTGFRFTTGSTAGYLGLDGCEAYSNTGYGFLVAGSTAPGTTWDVRGNRAFGNTAGNSSGTWSGCLGVAVNGLTGNGLNGF